MLAGLLKAKVIDADVVARDVTKSLIEPIKARFGDDLIVEGKLDRKLLAERAFADDDSAAALNAIIHPAVIAQAKRLLDATDGITVLDVPLLFESGMDSLCDTVIAVIADDGIRLQRAARFGDPARRDRFQWPQEKKAARANTVISNNGSLNELKKDVERIAKALIE